MVAEMNSQFRTTYWTDAIGNPRCTDEEAGAAANQRNALSNRRSTFPKLPALASVEDLFNPR